MAESINSFYKAELISMRGPWRNVDDVELATLGWVHWWNHQRLLEPIGNLPPVQFEQQWTSRQHTTTLTTTTPSPASSHNHEVSIKDGAHHRADSYRPG